KLRVAYLLEGNVRRQGSLLHVSVQLIDGGDGLEIWSKPFQRGRAELLNVQQDIAAAVVQRLLPESSQPIATSATLNATANELMLLARHYEQQVREREDVDIETLQRAVGYYRAATEADPESALAKSRLAGALLYLGDHDGAEAQASAALLLDPALGEVQHAFGKVLFARGSPNMGEPLTRAVELNPNDPDAIADYTFWYWWNVTTDGVAELYRRALDLDPLNVARYAALGRFLAVADLSDEVRALIEQMQRLFDGAAAYRAIAHLFDLVGDVDHAIAWTIKARDAEPGNVLHVDKLAEHYTDIGEFEIASALDPNGVGVLFKMRRYDEMIDEAELRMIDYPEDIQMRVYLAFAYKATGQFDAAVRMINTSKVLDSYFQTRRSTAESDAFRILVDAAYGSGAVDEARKLTELGMKAHYEWNSDFWWNSVGNACMYAILGDDDAVYRYLHRALEANVLAWEPMLKDQHCFKRFADDPAYLAVVKHFDDRRALLRARLPATLAHYGVAL
ncbi:MAG: hypothetical protein OEM63_10120, partial [Gammaproteobacteria bacterium]|nr:hypothetical protein [Gammaproteobacteria bacterium]